MYQYVSFLVKRDGEPAIFQHLELKCPVNDVRQRIQLIVGAVQSFVMFVSPEYEQSIRVKEEDIDTSEHTSHASQTFTVAKRGHGMESIAQADMGLDPYDLQGHRDFSRKFRALRQMIGDQVVVVHASNTFVPCVP